MKSISDVGDRSDAVAIQVSGVTKIFPGTIALDKVSMEIRPGEILALLGHNGSGKSTLIKTLSGYHEPDEGTLTVRGTRHSWKETSTTLRKRLHFIHQDLALVDDLTVVENFSLGTTRAEHIKWWQERRLLACEAEQLLARVGSNITPHTFVRDLTSGERCSVAVARSLRHADAADLLVLDEPTAYLEKPEVDRLLQIVRSVAASGVAVLFVTHNLSEAFNVCDSYIVLRDGRKVGSGNIIDTTRSEIVDLIAGDSLQPRIHPGGEKSSVTRASSKIETQRARVNESIPPRLSVQELHSRPLCGVSFDIQPGEIVGIAGLEDSGKSELFQCLFGVKKLSSGSIALNSHSVVLDTPYKAMRAGLAMVPRNRPNLGILRGMTVGENTSLAQQSKRGRLAMQIMTRIGHAKETVAVSAALARAGVRPNRPSASIEELSGGNQQKVVIAKWTGTLPDLLILEEPTQGVDVGARAEIHSLIKDVASKGCSVLVSASEEDELISIADRVIVLYKGEIVAEFVGPKDPEEIVRSVLGSHS